MIDVPVGDGEGEVVGEEKGAERLRGARGVAPRPAWAPPGDEPGDGGARRVDPSGSGASGAPVDVAGRGGNPFVADPPERLGVEPDGAGAATGSDGRPVDAGDAAGVASAETGAASTETPEAESASAPDTEIAGESSGGNGAEASAGSREPADSAPGSGEVARRRYRSSEASRRASRENSLASTGPVTPEGKAQSRQKRVEARRNRDGRDDPGPWPGSRGPSRGRGVLG